MRKKLLIASLLISSFSASAQVVRLGVGMWGFAPGKSSVGGQIPLIDLGYAPNPSMELGVYTGVGIKASADNATSGDVSGGFRYGVQGRYYFMTDKVFKPYLGVQAGMLSGGKIQVNSNVSDGKAENKFQVSPLAGFRLGPVNVWGTYQNKSVFANLGFLFGFGNFK